MTSHVRTRFTHIAVALVALGLTAGVLPNGKPEDVGLSSERLQRIGQVIQRYIDAKDLAGAVTVVSRRGKVAHFEAQGLMDVERNTPMRKDAIFRMASMSKPVTGVAILMLLEEGKVRLNDPVSKFIPEFKDSKVAIEKAQPPGAATAGVGRGQTARVPEIYTVPANREITIRDLMTHTSGLESGGAGTREGNRIAPRDTSSTLAAYIPKLGACRSTFSRAPSGVTARLPASKPSAASSRSSRA